MNSVLRLLITLPIFFVIGCGENSSVRSKNVSQDVVVQDGRLTNEFFKLTYSHPDNWYLLSNEELRQLLNFGEDLATADNDELGRVIDASRANQVALFGAFKHAPGTPVEYNPNVIVQAERVSHAPGIKSGVDYFFSYKTRTPADGNEF